MPITFKIRGGTEKTEAFLRNAKKPDIERVLTKYAVYGVNALSLATPRDSGETASSWNYMIEKRGSSWVISWTNDNIVNGVPVAILIQYGHATRSGTYVQGIDFINPAMKPIFEKISEDIWKEVTSK